MNVPVPPLPQSVSVTWTPTGSAVVVDCRACRRGTAIYTTVFRHDPEALARAVEEHRQCRE